MHRFVLLILLAAVVAPAVAPGAHAQELNCQITLNRDAITGTEFDFLGEFREELNRYLNGRAWTDDIFRPEERIDCQFQLTFTEAISQTAFRAQIVVQASRPIYGTAQRTTTFRASDTEWQFSYARGQNLIYDPNRFDPLTSVLDFYANLILGYDYDTFAPFGGTEFFERAFRIAELSRASEAGTPGRGWFGQGIEDRARFTLAQELLDPVFAPVRQAQYDYHFTVLDHFVIQHEQAWVDAMEILAALHELYLLNNRRRYVTDVFFGAKYQEIVSLLLEAPQANAAYALLTEMDPAHIGTYDGLVNSR